MGWRFVLIGGGGGKAGTALTPSARLSLSLSDLAEAEIVGPTQPAAGRSLCYGYPGESHSEGTLGGGGSSEAAGGAAG